MNPNKKYNVKAGEEAVVHTQRQFGRIIILIFIISATIGVLSGHMWLPGGMGRSLNSWWTRIISGTILFAIIAQRQFQKRKDEIEVNRRKSEYYE